MNHVAKEAQERVFWILEATDNPKFPYRLRIKKGEEDLLVLRVQDRWPGTRGHIFCLREEGSAYLGQAQEIERVPIISLKRYGKRLAIVLDRALNKRCEFLFLKKKYKQKEGEYEQIFWRTRTSLIQRKLKVKLTAQGSPSLHIIIDRNERYPYNFPGCLVERGHLPVGDYALVTEEGLKAVVERKTFENLLGDFGRMPLLHQALGELETYRHAVLVIEANYADFLNPRKLRFYSPSFAARALAEIQALHPHLTIIFAGNRKLGREWTLRFFSAIQAHDLDKLPEKLNQAFFKYEPPSDFSGGQYFEIRKAILGKLPGEFKKNDLASLISDYGEKEVLRVLRNLKKEGFILTRGRGKNRCWIKTGIPSD
jgi:hypothetical protein